MNKQILTFTIATAMLFTACNQNPKKENKSIDNTKTTITAKDNIVNQSLSDKNGNKLDMDFNNTKGMVTINFKGDEAELTEKKSASGIWYTNANYDLSGKENNIVLKKNGKTVFEHQDNIVMTVSKNENGDKLNLTFNNSQGTVKAYLNGGTEINMRQQKSASGYWYKNDHYELRGKGNDIQLKKDGKLVFEHQDKKVEIKAENDKGDVLNMTFNNTQGTVKAYLNGGEQIDLKEKKAASGIWYTNDHYELSGKGNKYELKKDGKTVFKN
ncbi:MAG: MliC family protein [Chitinophagales bacterium]